MNQIYQLCRTNEKKCSFSLNKYKVYFLIRTASITQRFHFKLINKTNLLD